MYTPSTLVHDVNTLAAFCGPRDVSVLLPNTADVFVLFGGSILAGGDVLAEAIRRHAAKAFVIVGGAGHTTETLRSVVQNHCPDVETDGLPEAVIFQNYLERRHGLHADFLETESTNCGNNITNLLSLLDRERIPCQRIVLCQDATMQRRMEAVLRLHAPDMRVLNYASYCVEAVMADGRPAFRNPPLGMWEFERYVTLLMGEISRLTDDANGYGPQGSGFLAHVDIPGDVLEAFQRLLLAFPHGVRKRLF